MAKVKIENEHIYTPIISGVTYYKIASRYPHDITKGCGLLSNEVDKNFYFLRGYDIKSVDFNGQNQLVLTRVNGDEIKSKSLEQTKSIQSIREKLRQLEEKDNDLEKRVKTIEDTFEIQDNGEGKPKSLNGKFIIDLGEF